MIIDEKQLNQMPGDKMPGDRTRPGGSLIYCLWQFCSYVFVPQWGRIKRNE